MASTRVLQTASSGAGSRLPTVLQRAGTILAGAALLVLPCSGSADDSVHARILKDLAARIKAPETDVKLFKTKPLTFQNSALGMPAEGRSYTPGPVAGELVVAGYRAARFVYMAGGGSFVFRGPVEAWAYSVAYLRTIPNEPNLNKDLIQATIWGTNPVLLFHAVSDFYPQDDGSIIAKRRTSRSGHELYYIGRHTLPAPRKLRSAFDFGQASVSEDGSQWAAVERMGPGGAYRVIVGSVKDPHAEIQTFDFPAEGTPGRLEWRDLTLFAEVTRDGAPHFFMMDLSTDHPQWKQSSGLPSDAAFMLNKSESVRVRQVTENGVPVARVERVWFTGASKLVGSIPDLRYEGASLQQERFVFVWGKRGDDTEAACTVDLFTGQVMPVEAVGVSHIRFLNQSPAGAPFSLTQILRDP